MTRSNTARRCCFKILSACHNTSRAALTQLKIEYSMLFGILQRFVPSGLGRQEALAGIVLSKFSQHATKLSKLFFPNCKS